MGRTEFPDLQLIESEPWLDTALFLIERNGALRSARISMLKKNLTSAGIDRDASLGRITGMGNNAFNRPRHQRLLGTEHFSKY